MGITPLIFASGRGSRLRPLTDSTPKPLLLLHNDAAALDFTIQLLLKYHFRKVYITYSYRKDLFEKLVYKYKNQIQILLLLDSSVRGHGGVLIDHIDIFDDAAILGINGDIVSDLDLSGLSGEVYSLSPKVFYSTKLSNLSTPVICDKNYNLSGVEYLDETIFYRKSVNHYKYLNNIGIYLLTKDLVLAATDVSDPVIGLFDKNSLFYKYVKLGGVVKCEEFSSFSYYFTFNDYREYIDTKLSLSKLHPDF